MLLADIARKNKEFYANKTAIVSGSARYSFGEFDDRVNSLVNALSNLGVNKGDKVILMSESCHQCVEVAFAGLKGGVIVSPLNPNLPQRGLAYLINNAEAKAIIVAENYKSAIESIRAEIEGVKDLIVIGTPAGEMRSYEDMISSYPPNEPKVELKEEDLLFLFCSGGTTGLPKHVMHTRRSTLDTTLNFVLDYQLEHDDVYFTLGPPYWGWMLAAASCIPFYKGCTSIVSSDISPESILEIIDKEKVTKGLIPFFVLSSILDYPDISKYDLSSMRCIILGGGAPGSEVLKRAKEVFGSAFGLAYGITEHTALTWLSPEEIVAEGHTESLKRLSSCGRRGFNILTRIVDEYDNDVPAGDIGELITSGTGVMEGYWKAPEATNEALKAGYFYTGDLARVDQEGYVYLVGRKKDIIISDGKIVAPAEIEDVLCWHVSIQEAAVIGVPDKELGEVVKAVVVLKGGQVITLEEIIGLCQQNLPDYAVPKSVEFVDSLPRSTLGKVLKSVLRETYGGHLEGDVPGSA